MQQDEARRILEALFFVSDKPLSVETFRDILEETDTVAIRAMIEALNAEYAAQDRSFRIREIAGGFQMLTEPRFGEWISKLYKRPPDRLSGPALETLAIIAYRQPLTRAEIEAIRGVNVDGVIHTLEERDLIRTRGRKEIPGRPILYGTTNEFLVHFGLKNLDELPKLKEFQEADLEFIREKNAALLVDKESGKIQNEVGAAQPQEAADGPQVSPE